MESQVVGFMNFLRKFLNREVILYLVFGVLTTVINIIVFAFLSPHMNYLIANVIAWFISVLFAFLTNRKMVFNSQAKTVGAYFKEALSFFGSRIATLVIESAILFIFIQCLHFNENLIKIVAQFIVIVANYVLSKWLVFKK